MFELKEVFSGIVIFTLLLAPMRGYEIRTDRDGSRIRFPFGDYFIFM